jgi:AraC-like DNA-binding protein/mannose-6-phosphate isomerase-like protein (cupin superfamily)
MDWHRLSPVFEPALSRAHLATHNHIFWLGEGQIFANQPSAPHWHDTYEIGIIVSGHGILVVDGQESPYAAGQVYVIDDLKPHMAYSKSDVTTLFVIHFQPALLRESWLGQVRAETHLIFTHDFSHSGSLLPLDDPFTAPVADLVLKIRDEACRRDAACEVIISGLLVQAMGYLARRLIDRQEVKRIDVKRREALQQIRPILHFIESHYAEPLTLEQMAQIGYLSRSHLCALFHLALNTTPVAYRNHRRLSEARLLLLQTDMLVQNIASQVGFSSPQEFNRLFVRENHVTPTQFRQRYFEAVQNFSS